MERFDNEVQSSEVSSVQGAIEKVSDIYLKNNVKLPNILCFFIFYNVLTN